jgi:predicted ester cyclase
MLDRNKAVVRRFYETTGAGDLSIIDELLAQDVVIHGSFGDHQGRDNIKQIMAGQRSTFPDWHVTVDDQIAEGDRVVSRLTVGGTHEGVMMGIEPTGKVVEFNTMFIDRLVDGVIVEGWHSPDYYSLFRQLGVFPE